MPRVARKPQSLTQKLIEACSAIDGVEKKGWNDRQKYNYVKAADVAKAFRRELFSRGILLLKDEKDIQRERIETATGIKMMFVTLTVEYTLLDSESGDTIVKTAFGDAMDSGDKALYKAKTGALKYFLRDLGIVPDEIDDPEADESVDDLTDPRLQIPHKQGKRSERIAEFQIRAWDAALNQTGKTPQQAADYLKQKFNVLRAADLAKADFNTAIKWAAQSGDLKDALETSLAVINQRKANGGEPQPVVKAVEYVADEEFRQ